MKRNIWIELEKLVAALLIMAFHIPHISADFSHIHFQSAHRFVEFFLIVTGYWTAKHFNEKSGRIIEYSFRKMIPLIPALLTSTVLEYFIELKQHVILSDGIINKINIIVEFILENLMLSGIVGTKIHLSTTWYIQAIMISLPVFILVCQRFKHYEVFCMIFSVLYYQYLNDVTFVFKDNARILAGLAVGGLCYYISEGVMKKLEKYAETNLKNFSRYRRFCICGGILSFLVPVTFSFYNIEQLNLFVLCFFISMVLLSRVGSVDMIGFVTILSDLPMTLYLFHWSIGTFLYFYSKNTYSNTVILYYLVTIVLAVIFIVIKGKIKENLNK